MSGLEQFVSLVLGLLVPFAVSAIKQNHWPDAGKIAVSLLLCVLIGLATSFTTHVLVLHRVMTLEEWLADAGLVFTSATSFYKLYFERTPANDVLEQLGASHV